MLVILQSVTDAASHNTYVIESVAISLDGTRIAAGFKIHDESDFVKVFDTASKNALVTIEGKDHGGKLGVNSLCFSPDGSMLAIGGDTDREEHPVHLLDTASGSLVRSMYDF